jgi:YidC/Oxa1 family membrane protein insertase
MEKRLALAFVLTAVLLIVWQTFFPPVTPPPARRGADSTAAAAHPAAGAAAPATAIAPSAAGPARTIVVHSPLYEYRFSTRGAALAWAELLKYPSYVHRGERVQLVPSGATDVLSGVATSAGRTLDLRAADFQPSAERVDLRPGDAPKSLTFTAVQGGVPVAQVTYTFRANDYLVDVSGRLLGLGGAGTLTTSLGTGLAPHDAKEHGTARELSFVAWNGRRVEREYLAKIKPGVQDTIAGPLAWAGIKDRYFLMALLPKGREFTRLVAVDQPDESYRLGDESLVSPRASGTVSLPIGTDGSFAYQAYLGPLEHDRLVAVGHQLEEVNPYGYRWLRPVIRPIAAFVLWALRAMHDNLGLAYGWVLLIFGILVRLITWPLNARAMRSQMKNMAVQPVMQARMKDLQAKYANDPQRQQQEMLKMYQELGVNPFSMMSGCLPMLIPMPVLITLFFVFQGAIEFRGTGFLWLPDLSLRDPFYLLPILLVVSMFALQWVSTKLSGMEQNPQAKTMMYTMPLMMGFFFWFMPSGLNLYYVSSNLASLPQQILIARERRAAMDAQKAADAAKAAKRAPAQARRR